MTLLSAQDFSNQMIAQLRILDPSVSAEVGTPERKIIDTVAATLALNQVDMTGLAGALDIDSKYGTNLDRFTQLFGFARQSGGTANGYVVFSRNTAAPAAITIPAGVSLQANTVGAAGQPLQYTTVAGGTIAQGAMASGAVPIICISAGTQGNAAANTITQIVGQIVAGVTAVTNAAPISGGIDIEDDNSYKVRFKNTVFRNMAGTEDQYLATAVSTPFTTKANVIGPISKYQEYIQVPSSDDAGYLNGAQSSTSVVGSNSSGQKVVNLVSTSGLAIGMPIGIGIGLGTVEYNTINVVNSGTQVTLVNNLATTHTNGEVFAPTTAGAQGQWTTALSAIPYAQDIYTTPGPFLSNSGTITGAFQSPQTVAVGQYFYRVGTDYNFNYPPLIVGDALRQAQTRAIKAPNFTFLNVFNPASLAAPLAGLQSLTPKSVVLSEFSYLSSASRNSIAHNVQNCVDIYVDGSNPVQTSCLFQPGVQAFSAATTDPLYVENFRRDGLPATRPHPGNFFSPLLQTPLTALPTTVTVGANTYYLGVHYWLVHETDNLNGSVRARDGIEWSNYLASDAGSQLPPGWPTFNPLAPYTTATGPTFNNLTSGTQVQVTNYNYDSNIPILQASIEAVRQITTDVLVHSAKLRYFKLDVTVMYNTNANPSLVNTAIGTSLQAFLTGQFFGTVLQLSDLLDVVHQVPGVDNVRWSNDLPNAPNNMRVIETDAFGNPLYAPTVDRVTAGTAGSLETQRLYVPGALYPLSAPNANFGALDTFTLAWADPVNIINFVSAPILFNNLTAATVQTGIRAFQPGSGMYNNIVVTQDTWTRDPQGPIASFQLVYGANGTPYLPSVPPLQTTVTQSTYAYNGDFFLHDNELPSLPSVTATGDTVPGVIIRPRAQNTFARPGIG